MIKLSKWPLLLLSGCAVSDDAQMVPIDLVVPCERLSASFINARIWWPETHRGNGLPALVYRVGGADSDGYEINFSNADLLMEGIAVLQHLTPISDDFWSMDEQHAIECVVDYVRNEPPDVGALSSLIITGLSVGGNVVLNSVVSKNLDVDGVVLWESPFVDELILLEVSPGMMIDPTFVEGGCTLDSGCLFDGRDTRLGFDSQTAQLFVDEDQDGILGTEEATYRREAAEEGYAYSRELTDLAQLLFFEENKPPLSWVSGAELDQFWLAKDATEALISIRDNGSALPFTYVAGQTDHVQLVQAHIHLAIEGLSGASHFLLNDADFFDINLSELPEESATVLVSSAEIAMVDARAVQ